MRILALALCGALLAGGLAAAAPADRAQLLQRLEKAIPPMGDQADFGAKAAADAVERLAPLNPGREADINAAVKTYAACANGVMNEDIAMKLIVQAVDKGMTDAEILALVEFYEGPQYARFMAAVERMGKGTPSAEDEAILQAIGENPHFLKFMQVMITEVTAFVSTPKFVDGMTACETGFDAALAKAGLKAE